MAGYVANTQISQPLKTSLKADADLGGMKFSYQHGLFYEVTEPPTIIRMPLDYYAGKPATGRMKTGPSGT